jgi:hypothetical protein
MEMSGSGPPPPKTISQPGAPGPETVPPGIIYAVEQIKEIAKGPASNILFFAGMAFLCVVLFVKYGPQVLLGKGPVEVSSLDYLGSVTAAVLLLLAGAIIRYAIHAQEIAKIGEFEKTQMELTMKINADVQAAIANRDTVLKDTLENIRKKLICLEKAPRVAPSFPHILNTPNRVSGIGAFSATEKQRPNTRRVSAGVMMPSSQSRAVA